MDSITQAALGAALARVSLPSSVPLKPLLIAGAVLGTLPDLDLLISPWQSDVDIFIKHRGATHSLIVLPLVALLATGLLARFVMPFKEVQFWRLYWTCALVLMTHPLLDVLTTYGTQLLWPLDKTPFALSAIFIVDPVYTLPLLLAVLVGKRRQKIIGYTLAGTSIYLVLAILLQASMETRLKSQVADAPPMTGDLQITMALNTPLNILFWRGLYITDDGYAVQHRYIWQNWSQDSWLVFPNSEGHDSVKTALADHPQFAPLAKFSHQAYHLRREGNQWVYADLRMGAEEWDFAYIFRYRLGYEDALGEFQPDPAFQRLR